MVVNNPVVAEEDEEETLGPNIWSKEEEDDDDDDDKAATTFFLSMPKLSRWICMYVSKGFYYWKMNHEKSLGMPKRERIRFSEKCEERREHVMSKREHVKICSCFLMLLLIVAYAYI